MPIEMREPTFWILTALASGPKHGYALLEETRELSLGRVALKVPTLYAALSRLQDEGLVTHVRDEVIDGRQRRYFGLSTQGGVRLQEEAARLESNASAARRSLASRDRQHGFA